MRLTYNIQLLLLTLSVVAAAAYLVILMSGLAWSAAQTSRAANVAPSGSFSMLELTGPDYIMNWDFVSGDINKDAQDKAARPTWTGWEKKVDWPMRFIFAGQGTHKKKVQDLLDGQGEPPIISVPLPQRGGFSDAQSGWVDDGPERVLYNSSRWHSDKGLKNVPDCVWNAGHMRIYGRLASVDPKDKSIKNYHNHNTILGEYVVAAIHKDKEDTPFGVDCDQNFFRSLEADEKWWLDRVRTYLTASPYNWSITLNGINWGNVVSKQYVNPGDDETHQLESDGKGSVIWTGPPPTPKPSSK